MLLSVLGARAYIEAFPDFVDFVVLGAIFCVTCAGGAVSVFVILLSNGGG